MEKQSYFSKPLAKYLNSEILIQQQFLSYYSSYFCKMSHKNYSVES